MDNPDEGNPLDFPIKELEGLAEAEDPEFLAQLERAISDREAAAAIGHVHSVGLARVLFSYLELAFRLLLGGEAETNDEDKRS